jgi:hypothetical protein
MRTPLCAVALVAAAAASAAQTPVPRPRSETPPATGSATRPQKVAVTIQGCISGNRLQPTASASNDAQFALLNATDFTLQGSRDLLQVLTRDHAGHLEEITGIATIPPTPGGSTVDTKTVRKGKSRVTVGVRESGGAAPGNGAMTGDAPLPVPLRVQGATHIDDHCSPRR